MDFILNLIVKSGGQVWLTFLRNWPFLALSVALAALLKLYLNPQRVSAFLLRHQNVGVIGATTIAVTTPLCSCGTTALVLGMIANLMPWAPIVAFMVSSPLTSPQGLVYSAGIFGWQFSLAFFAASILLGLAGGIVAAFFDRQGWLANQTRQSLQTMQATRRASQPIQPFERSVSNRNAVQISLPPLVLEPAGCACGAAESPRLLALDATGCACDTALKIPAAPLLRPACGCSEAEPVRTANAPACGCAGEGKGLQVEKSKQITLRMLLEESFSTGKRLLVMFLGFAFIGYFLNGLIPAAWVTAIFGSGNAFSVPLAATLGLPLYVNSEASLPLVRTMLDAGMSQGAALAFLITGAGTSFGAVAGMLTIARWRVVALVIGTLWVGSIVFGVLYNLVF